MKRRGEAGISYKTKAAQQENMACFEYSNIALVLEHHLRFAGAALRRGGKE